MAQRNKVGHYDIVAELGRGGMGVVYKGYESSLNRHVAIKMLSEALADDASVVERFFREARSMAQLNDPHIVQIYLVGEDQGQPYFAMEFVEGESLSGRLKRERLLDPFEAARILLQVAQGLAAAHDRGVIHRDIKPANLLITQRGVIKVADFGIALASQDYNKKLTGTGQFVGTPGYLSPEVCLGKPVDQRSDIFALGIVFFEMLTGQTPYKDESPLGMMLEVVQAEIPDVRRINESVDPQLSAILKRMVAKDPADRYADCHQLIADLVALGINAATPVPVSRPQSNPALGTVVNAPTPPEMRRLATPAPAPAPPPIPTPAPVYRTEPAQALPPPQQLSAPRKPSVLPWAAAVLALVGGSGAAAWYYGGLKEKLTAPTVMASTTGAPATASAPPTTAPVTDAPAASTAAPNASVPATPPQPAADTPSTSLPAANADAPATVAAQTTPPVSPAAADPATSSVPASTQSPSATSPMLAEAAPADAGGDRAAAPALPPATPQSAEIGSRIAEMRERRLEGRGVKADRRTTQVARANLPPPVESAAPSYNGPPRVIVLGIGDPAVATVAENSIEERLSETGIDLVDEDLVRGLSDAESGSRDVPRLLAAVARNAEYVVVVRAEPNGQQQLEFYGESMTQYIALLQVAVYDVRAARKVGAGWQTQVSFTHLNAADNTREALAPYMAKIVQGVGGRGRG